MSIFQKIKTNCPELTGRFSPTLDLYILRMFLAVYSVNLLSFCLIFVLIDTFSYTHLTLPTKRIV